MTIQEKAKRAQSVIEFVKDGSRYEEAADLFGLSVGYVKLLCYKDGVKAIQGAKEKRNVDMQSYKEQGHSMKQVAEHFGVSQSVAQKVCRGIAPQKARPQVYHNGWNDERKEANAIRIINERSPMFEYVGGFTNTDGFVDIRCKTCGAVLHKSFVSIRHGKATCESCAHIESEKRKAHEKLIKTQKKEWEEAGKRKAKQLSFAVCDCCGSLFFPTSGYNKAYCSDECRRKASNTISKDKRLRRISKVLVDKDIDLKDLFKRDNGVCAICGKRCRWDDSSTRDDGTFLAFGDYPSIDHIVPLSKGGKHSWNNVQLACRSCNSRKGNRV